MSERTVSIAAAKARLSELVAAAEAGEDVVITKRGRPVVRLVAEPKPKPHRPIDLDWLREMTKDIPRQEEDSGTFIRRLRDDARY
jgi:prevent-host-death family protein